jgi:hypothetical protein
VGTSFCAEDNLVDEYTMRAVGVTGPARSAAAAAAAALCCCVQATYASPAAPAGLSILISFLVSSEVNSAIRHCYTQKLHLLSARSNNTAADVPAAAAAAVAAVPP